MRSLFLIIAFIGLVLPESANAQPESAYLPWLPTGWLTCNDASDCRFWHDTCGHQTAVNVAHAVDAKKLLCQLPCDVPCPDPTPAPSLLACQRGSCVIKE